MEQKVFITKVSAFLPNEPVLNEDMESYLGKIGGIPSRVKSIVLRQNGIKKRYYALDAEQNITHSNAEMAGKAISQLLDESVEERLGVLACASSTPDQMLPSHAAMTHGALGNKPLEIYSQQGVCLTAFQALKAAYMSVKCEETEAAICSASELVSPTFFARNYDPEYEKCHDAGTDPYMAFEKDFMRYMLSDGAGAVLLENRPSSSGLSLELNWINMISYANELPVCMFMASEVQPDGRLKSWKEFTPQEIADKAILVGKQDIRVLKKYIIKYWVDHLEACFAKNNLNPSDITYVIPHVSSMFFYGKLAEEITNRNIDLPTDKWFTNLPDVGNIGSASIYVALEELFHSNKLKVGDKILLLVPESGRFSSGTALLTVC